MSAPIDDGGPAFPCPSFHEDATGSWPKGFPGISMRDYFAGQALAGMIASESFQGKQRMSALAKQGIDVAGFYAMSSYALADAMITERARP
jgi:hypothetical protein